MSPEPSLRGCSWKGTRTPCYRESGNLEDPKMIESALNEIDQETAVFIAGATVSDPYNPIEIEIWAAISMYPIPPEKRKTKKIIQEEGLDKANQEEEAGDDEEPGDQY